MADNGLLAHELLSYMSNSCSKNISAALKLDMNKAYDKVNWDFLWDVLRRFGFPPYWVHILQQCVTTVSYQLLVNGSPSTPFIPKCGLRQGDPLSPYLFVLCMEILSLMLRRAELRGIRIASRAPSISHLFFADNELIFFHVSPEACDNVLSVVNEFCSISGQMINIQKSFVRFSSNTPVDYREYLSHSLKMQARPSIGNYLGLPVDMGRSKCKKFQFVIDRLVQRLSVFSSLRLSAAAKLVVINSVFIASFNHVLSVFKLPSTICDKINSLLLRFWWKSGETSKGLALAPAAAVYLPMGLGGLGIRHIQSFNVALLAQQAWRLRHNPQLLASRVLTAKYSALLQHRSHFSGSRSSWGSHGLLQGNFSLSEALSWKIGSGKNISILDDNWLPNVKVSFKDPIPSQARPMFVSGLFSANSTSWDPSKVRSLFPQLVAMSILSLERPLKAVDDFVYWKYTQDDKFSTKSTYLHILSQHVNPPVSFIPPSWWKRLWGLPILPKWKMLAWKIVLDALPSMAVLSRKGIISGLSSGKFWSILDYFFGVCWAIWLTRNNVRFRSAVYSPNSILELASDWCFRSQNARILTFSQIDKPPGFPFQPTSFALCGKLDDICDILMLFDGAWDRESHEAGTGWLFCNAASQHPLGGGAKACVAGSTLHSELLACLYGLQQARSWGISKLLLLTDCSIIATLLLCKDLADVSVCAGLFRTSLLQVSFYISGTMSILQMEELHII
ncbi:uncharacterized protein LOC110683240 [Chenopodium quinoa]|uniref:uncharacterized protein LOC110683240 n=1 Tax=Chenopodium quinoa TaxID=63459 RepID=UPI000B778FF3|nr:uncharacterized protein LOC110683240 [Chenopodium quinoa]